MEEKDEMRWYISNGTCSWFNKLRIKKASHNEVDPENSWDNFIWFNNKQEATDFKNKLQKFINVNYFNKQRKS
ncbi:MAG: hypothetical protein KBS70_00370 [Bacteroidales bacterium]|nr:hypothetical protein [Candidatus Colicola equi]